MHNEIFEKVKAFLVKSIEDKNLRDRFEASSTSCRCQLLREAGFDSHSEFEAGLVDVLVAKEKGELNELSEEDLVTVFGGIASSGYFQPLYGVVYPTDPIADPSLPHLPGKPIGNPVKPPEAIAMYGVVIARNSDLL
jgi:hypothetical protein